MTAQENKIRDEVIKFRDWLDEIGFTFGVTKMTNLMRLLASNYKEVDYYYSSNSSVCFEVETIKGIQTLEILKTGYRFYVEVGLGEGIYVDVPTDELQIIIKRILGE